jgi:diguanylate cyclase (GGDEF)-like protein
MASLPPFLSWFRKWVSAAPRSDRLAAEEQPLQAKRACLAEQRATDLLYMSNLLSELNQCESAQTLSVPVLEQLRTLVGADQVCLTMGTTARGLKVHSVSGQLPSALEFYRDHRFQRQSGGSVWISIETGRPVYVADYSASDAPSRPLSTGMPGAAAYVPFGRLDGEVGILTAFRTEGGREWSTRERGLLESTSRAIGHMLQRSQRYLELSRMAAYTDALTRVRQLTEQLLPLHETALQALELIAGPADVDLGVLVRLHGDTMVNQVQFQSKHVTPALLQMIEQTLSLDHQAVWQELQPDKPLFIDVFTDAAGEFQRFAAAGVSSLAFVPWSDGQAGGLVLVIARVGDARTWSLTDQELFMNAANSIRLSYERQLALSALHEAAESDPLTGLGNRRALNHALRNGLTEAREAQSSLHVISLDLDGLKKINDTEGHEYGDALLVHLATALRSTFQDEDSVFRVGGDEFVVLVKSSGSVARALEGLCTRISAVEEQLRNSGVGFQDLSAGIATFPVDSKEGKALLRVSDQRMYVQKNEHRRGRRE